METLGWVFVLLAALIVRGAAKGRGLADNYHDIGDLFIAVLSMDTAGAKAVLSRSGSSTVANDPNNVSAAGVPATPPQTHNGQNIYDVHTQMTRQAYNAAHPNDGGRSLRGGTQA